MPDRSIDVDQNAVRWSRQIRRGHCNSSVERAQQLPQHRAGMAGNGEWRSSHHRRAPGSALPRPCRARCSTGPANRDRPASALGAHPGCSSVSRSGRHDNCEQRIRAGDGKFVGFDSEVRLCLPHCFCVNDIASKRWQSVAYPCAGAHSGGSAPCSSSCWHHSPSLRQCPANCREIGSLRELSPAPRQPRFDESRQNKVS